MTRTLAARRTPTADIPRPTFFTSGQCARMFGVAPRTISKWVDAGRLAGHRLPDSGDRRVTAAAIRDFCGRYGFPVPACVPAAAVSRIALHLEPSETAALAAAGWLIPATGFEAATAMAAASPAAVLVGDGEGVAGAVALATAVALAHPDVRVALVVSEDCPADVPGWAGPVIRRPCALTAEVPALTAGAGR